MAKKGKTINSVGDSYKDKRGNTMPTGSGYRSSGVGSKANSEFQTCNACPNPASCKASGRCMLKEFGDK